MPDATPVYGWPIPVLTDDPNIPGDMTALALAIEQYLSTTVSTAPVGDSSNSAVLTDADISTTAGQNKTIIPVTLDVTHDQWVILGGRANFTNTASNAALIGLYIDVAGVVVPELTSGNVTVGTASPDDRRQLTLTPFPVFLVAGTYTIRLRMDRADNNVTTIIARAQDTGNITSAPCLLSVVV